jgi:hypothetical protein
VDRLVSLGDPLGERSQFRKAQAQAGTEEHGGQASQALALVDHITLQGRNGAPQNNERLPIVA